MNASMLAANIGAYGYFMMDNAYASGLAMLGTTTTLSSIMGVTLTMAIGGRFILYNLPLSFICLRRKLGESLYIDIYDNDVCYKHSNVEI